MIFQEALLREPSWSNCGYYSRRSSSIQKPASKAPHKMGCLEYP